MLLTREKNNNNKNKQTNKTVRPIRKLQMKENEVFPPLNLM